MVLALPLASTETFIALLLVALGGLAAYLGVRQAARVAAGRLLARPADDGSFDIAAAERAKRIRTLQALSVRVAGVVIVVIVALMALDTFNINIGPAIAGLGVAGIAIGLGAQTLVRDWLAGVFILAENQFSRGDVIRVAGVSGVVEELSLRRTVLRDLDGTVHSVPNGQITVASNMTRLFARVNLDVQVAYGTNLDEVTALLDATCRDLAADPDWETRIIDGPSVLRVDALADSGVTIKIVGRVRAGEQWKVTGELRKRILAAFPERAAGYPLRLEPVVEPGKAAGGAQDDAAREPHAGDPAAPRTKEEI